MGDVLRVKTLLFRGCEAGEFGECLNFDGCGVRHALFAYLTGTPCDDFDSGLLKNRPLVCMSDEWEDFLLKNFPDAKKYTRWHMHPRKEFDFSKVKGMPEGYEVKIFGRDEYEARPFGHCENYRDFEDFAQNGAGAAAYFEGEIVSAASSFLSLDGEVELDVSTLPEHRRRHLAENCVARMLRDCENRGIWVHWDAQNSESKALAEKFGFEEDQEYTVYWI